MKPRGDAELRGAQSRQRADSAAREAARPSSHRTIAASQVAGIRVHNLSEDETVDAIARLIDEGGPRYAAVVNAAKIVAANKDNALQAALLEADLVTADGMSVVWASRLLGQPLKERVTGIELFQRLVRRASERGWAVYFLGARDESVRAVVERFTSAYPTLRVAGYHNGYFDASESAAIAEVIKQSSSDLLFVAMGSPAQECWIRSNLEATGARFALGVGGSFDHVSGLARRAPGWMQRSGLEWLYRLIREPRRLWRRYLGGNIAFVWLVIRQRLLGRDG
ncbi:MAG: WecB/TagA/CpsF family glycosyltransferase [Blastocatellia bacterium]